MYLDLTEDGSEFLIKYTPREADLLSLVGGLRRSGDSFISEKSLAMVLQLKALCGGKLDYSEGIRQWGINERKNRKDRATNTISGRFLQHQIRGSNWLINAENAILAYPAGTGKTATAIRSLCEVDSFPALVVCPNTLKRTWKNEFEKWAPHLNVIALEGTASKRKKDLSLDADVYIINYESLASLSYVGRYGSLPVDRKNSALNEKNFKVIIVDECQRIINAKAKGTRCVKELARSESIKYRWALSATPIRDTPADFWSLLNYFEPSIWTSKSKFIDMFCQTSISFWGGLDIVGIKPHRRELFDEIVDLYLDFVVKEDVLPDLPPKTYSTRYIPLAGKQLKQYKAMLDDMIIKTDEGEYIIATSPLTASARLSQAAAATLEVIDDEVILRTPSCKIDAVIELAEEMGGQPFVGFASSKKLINLCADKLRKLDYKVVLITGDQSTQEREYNIQAFQEGRANILLMTSAGSEGITLTAASTLVFIQLPWSNVLYSQVSDRVHRIGSVGDRVNIINLVSENTMEEKIIKALDDRDEHLSNLLKSQKELYRWITE